MSTTEPAAATISLARLDAPLSPTARSRLSSCDRRRAERFSHDEARAAFLAGRALARLALSGLTAVDPSDWRFRVMPSGRPEVAAPQLPMRPRFSISHTAGLVACIATLEIDCGLDVESLDRRIDPLRIARHSFAPAEIEALSRLRGDELRERFFALWTLKEAYLKARGDGIRLRLDAVSFDLGTPKSIGARVGSERDESPGWQFSLFRPSPRHLMAVALALSAAPRAKLTGAEFDLSEDVARQLELVPIASDAV